MFNQSLHLSVDIHNSILTNQFDTDIIQNTHRVGLSSTRGIYPVLLRMVPKPLEMVIHTAANLIK